MSKPGKKSLGFWEVTAIGVGGMVGGGIFAVLGLAVELTSGGAPVAFLIAGIVALVTSYSYVRLSVTYQSQGGTAAFLDQAFGSGLLTGSVNILLWISYIIMLSLYAYAFGSYGASFFPTASQLFWKHILVTGSIIGITGPKDESKKWSYLTIGSYDLSPGWRCLDEQRSGCSLSYGCGQQWSYLTTGHM